MTLDQVSFLFLDPFCICLRPRSSLKLVMTKFALFVCMTFLHFQPSYAQSFEFPSFGGPPGPPMKTLRVQGAAYQKSKNTSDDHFTSISPKSIALSVPVIIKDNETWTVGASYHHFEIGTESRLKKGTPIPSVFKATQFNVGWSQKESNDRFWAANLSSGSPSDEPFADEKQLSLNASLIRGLDKQADHQWMLILFYSNNSSFLRGIPVPGFAYSYFPTKELRGVFGIPFAFVKWDYHEKWTMMFALMAFQKIKFENGYRIFGPAQIAVGIETDQQVFMRRDRPKEEERFSYEERKVYMTLKSPLNQSMYAELNIGHSFDRSFFEVEKYSDRTDNNLNLGNAAYVSAHLTSRF